MSTLNTFADVTHPQPTTIPPPHRRRRRRRNRPSRRRRPSHTLNTDPTTTDGGGSSFGLSDSDAQSSARVDYSSCGSSGMMSYNNNNHSCMESESEEVDLESGELEMKVHCGCRDEKQCRICHLSFFDGGGTVEEYGGDDGGGGCDGGGGVIQLGCNCKGDLGTAHKQCAETWFKIKGNMVCEICGATAQNVGGDQTHEMSHTITEIEPVDRSATGPMMVTTEPRTFWQGRRIMNILLGCMVFAFIISWLFHFNVLP